MIDLTTQCAICGADFTPSHADYVRGIWRTCARCRDGPEPQGGPSPGTPVQERHGPNNASEMSTRKEN